MNDEERLILMKERIIRSFKWHKDVIVPLADEFGISVEEMENIFMNTLDMGSLEALHSTLDSAEYLCLQKKIYADLRLCWLSGTLELISHEDADNLKIRLADEVYNNNKKYEDALEEGRAEILQKLKERSNVGC